MKNQIQASVTDELISQALNCITAWTDYSSGSNQEAELASTSFQK